MEEDASIVAKHATSPQRRAAGENVLVCIYLIVRYTRSMLVPTYVSVGLVGVAKEDLVWPRLENILRVGGGFSAQNRNFPTANQQISVRPW